MSDYLLILGTQWAGTLTPRLEKRAYPECAWQAFWVRSGLPTGDRDKRAACSNTLSSSWPRGFPLKDSVAFTAQSLDHKPEWRAIIAFAEGCRRLGKVPVVIWSECPEGVLDKAPAAFTLEGSEHNEKLPTTVRIFRSAETCLEDMIKRRLLCDNPELAVLTGAIRMCCSNDRTVCYPTPRQIQDVVRRRRQHLRGILDKLRVAMGEYPPCRGAKYWRAIRGQRQQQTLGRWEIRVGDPDRMFCDETQGGLKVNQIGHLG